MQEPNTPLNGIWLPLITPERVKSENQLAFLNFGRPDSAIVGTSGRTGRRSPGVTASTRTCPEVP